MTIGQILEIKRIMLERRLGSWEKIQAFIAAGECGLVFASGPMRGDKTALLIEFMTSVEKTLTVLCVKPQRENRKIGLWSRTGNAAPAHTFGSADELRQLIEEHDPKVIIFDEGHFVPDDEIPGVCDVLCTAAQTMLVFVGMLDKDYLARNFATYTALVEAAQERLQGRFLHLMLTGVCQGCDDKHATHSRLITAPPSEGGNIKVGDAEYLTVCARCHSA